MPYGGHFCSSLSVLLVFSFSKVASWIHLGGKHFDLVRSLSIKVGHVNVPMATPVDAFELGRALGIRTSAHGVRGQGHQTGGSELN